VLAFRFNKAFSKGTPIIQLFPCDFQWLFFLSFP